MKGALKKVRVKCHEYCKTNFDDWSDPKCKAKIKSPLLFDIKEAKDDEETEAVKQTETLVSIISQTSVEINNLRQKIKDGYPLLTRKEIRNIKLPFHESLLLNILEDGFIATHKFIKDLIDMDEAWHKYKDRSLKKRHKLKSNIAALQVLCKGLTKAEIAKLENNNSEELRLLLEMAIFFNNPEEDSLHWLSGELYEQCVTVFNDTDSGVGQELQATTMYLYASFLLDVYFDTEHAKALVEESMKLSKGNFWNPSKITGGKSDVLYIESCLLLHKIYLVMAHNTKERNIEEAIQLCRNSLYWAKQISHKEAEATALLNLIIIYIKARQFELVSSYIENFMSVCVELKDINGLCEGYILKADFHEQIGEDDLVISDIKDLLKVAEENEILKIMALAHKKLAVFYLIQGKEKEMNEHAVKAYEYYVTLNDKFKMEEARCLTGIAQAHEILTQYIRLLVEAEGIETVEFKILTLWKSLHIPFFSNVKLFHPEAPVNEDLKDRLQISKAEEIKAADEIRLSELKSHMSITRIPSKLQRTSTSSSVGMNVSKSVLNFQRQMKSATDVRSFSKISSY